MSGGAVDAGSYEALAPGTAVKVEVGDVPVCVVRVGDEVFAVHDICTHALESLCGGWVDDDRIECPRHGAQFSLRTGEALTPPATRPVPTFPVRVEGDRILVDPAPSHPHPLVS